MSDLRQPPFQRGEKLSAKRLNDAVGSRVLRSTGDGEFIQSTRVGDEVVSTVDPHAIAQRMPKHICRFIVKEVLLGYLRCRTWNGTTEGETDINVAK